MDRRGLTDEQWEAIQALIPDPPHRPDRRGRPWRDAREVLGGVLWVLRNDAHWRDLPEHFPPHQTCRRRFQQWVSDGTLKLVLEKLEEDLRERGGLDITSCRVEDSLSLAKVVGRRPVEVPEQIPWQQQTAMLLLSGATQRLLRRMRSHLVRKLWLPNTRPSMIW